MGAGGLSPPTPPPHFNHCSDPCRPSFIFTLLFSTRFRRR